MYNEIELEFGTKYNSLQFLSQLKELETFKSDKKATTITDLKRLHHNMLMLTNTHKKQTELGLNVYSLIEEYKEKKEIGGKGFNKKEEIEKVVNSMYDEFKNTIGIDIKHGIQEKKGGIKIINEYNFLSKRIDKKKVILKEVGDKKIVSVKLGDFLMDGFNNSKGFTKEKIGQDFEKAMNDDNFKSMIVKKVKGRLFNIQREINKGDGDRGLYERIDNKLLGFEYKEAYDDLKEIEKEFSKYIKKDKVKEFFISVKQEAKNSFHNEHKDYSKDKKLKELENEIEKLKELLSKKDDMSEKKERVKKTIEKIKQERQSEKEKEKHETTLKEQNERLKTIDTNIDKMDEKLRRKELLDKVKKDNEERKQKEQSEKLEKKKQNKEIKKTKKDSDGYLDDKGFWRSGKKKK